ncbi:MAG: hypothetical protein WD314_05680 [Trueperaceae bacterium]
MKFGLLKFSAAILVAMIAAQAGSALAQVNINGPRQVSLAPGESRVLRYTIVNRGDSRAEARIFFNDYAQLSNGSLQHIPATSLPQSLFQIAELERLEFVLEPGETAEVPMSVTVPDEPEGGYWGVIGVEVPPSADTEQGNALMFNIRYAMVTAVEIEGVAEHELGIENLSSISVDDGAGVVVTIRNSGNGYQRFTLTLSLDGSDGASETIEKQGVALPGLTIDFPVALPAELAAGRYGVFAVLEYQEGLRAEAVTTITIETER